MTERGPDAAGSENREVRKRGYVTEVRHGLTHQILNRQRDRRWLFDRFGGLNCLF
jgi:hypothetical protein